MSRPRGGLGRGLAALIPTGPQTSVVSDVLMGGVDPNAHDSIEKRSPSRDADWEATTRRRPATWPPQQRQATDGAEADRVDKARSGQDDVGPRYEEIPIAAIQRNPRNPRTVFDEDALAELEHSIREFGMLQPVVVRPAGDGFELVLGERRWRAAQRAGLHALPAIVRRTEDADLLRNALLENIHRADLNPLEEAAAYQQLLDEFGVTQEELATRIGRSRPVISNTIRLLKLPLPVQRRVAAGVLSAGHARALLSLDDPDDQEVLATRVVAEGLSVRGTEEAIVLMAGRTLRTKRTAAPRTELPSLSSLADRLSDAFDTRVRVELGRQKGRMVVEFATVDDLERIVGLMAPTALRTAGSIESG